MSDRAFIVAAVVAAGLSFVLAGCGGAATTTTTTTTTLFNANVKWVFSSLIESKPLCFGSHGVGLGVGADGTVFLPAEICSGDDAFLVALDGDHGGLRWQFGLADKALGAPVMGLHGSAYFLTGNDADSEASAQAVNGDGTGKWTQDFNESRTGKSLALDAGSRPSLGNSVALGSDGTVFMSRYIQGLSQLFALDGMYGTVKWQTSFGTNPLPSPVAAPDDTIFVTDSDGNCFALQGADGSLKWNASVPSKSSSPSLGANGTVLICSSGGLVALDGHDGALKWQQPAACSSRSSRTQNPGPTVGSDGTVFVESSEDGDFALFCKLLALNGNDGSLKWGFGHQCDGASFTKAAVSASGIVYVGLAGSVYALDADGTIGWISTSSHAFFTRDYPAPVIGPDGTVYVINGLFVNDLVAFYGKSGPATVPYTSGYIDALSFV